jgi:carbonic anhydrase
MALRPGRRVRRSPRFRIRLVTSGPDLEAVRGLFVEYRDWLAKHREVTAFADAILEKGLQDFDREIRGLPGSYRPPNGALYLAMKGKRPVGCAALRRLTPVVGELKRLYVRVSERGLGIGEHLSRTVLRRAQAVGYRRVVLDTLPAMGPAISLYRKIGFDPIPAYWPSPVADSLFFEYRLNPASAGRRRSVDPHRVGLS